MQLIVIIVYLINQNNKIINLKNEIKFNSTHHFVFVFKVKT
jgi:hypothetical protein